MPSLVFEFNISRDRLVRGRNYDIWGVHVDIAVAVGLDGAATGLRGGGRI